MASTNEKITNTRIAILVVIIFVFFIGLIFGFALNNTREDLDKTKEQLGDAQSAFGDLQQKFDQYHEDCIEYVNVTKTITSRYEYCYDYYCGKLNFTVNLNKDHTPQDVDDAVWKAFDKCYDDCVAASEINQNYTKTVCKKYALVRAGG